MIEPRPLTRDAFAPFGDVIDASHPNRFEINDGFTTRVHDLFEPKLPKVPIPNIGVALWAPIIAHASSKSSRSRSLSSRHRCRH